MDDRTRLLRAAAELQALLDKHELPPPDEVEELPGRFLFLWHEAKVAVEVCLEDDIEGPLMPPAEAA